MKSEDSYSDFPIAICDGLCGVDKSDDLSMPLFFATSFDGSQTISYRPKHLFKYDDKQKQTLKLTPVSSTDTPSSDQLIETIKLFQQTNLAKVVLAKKRTYNLRENTSFQSVLSKLQENFSKDSLFVYAANESSIFFGASPENLFKREGNNLFVDCVAGTVKKGNEDDLFTPKMIEEHAFVTQSVKESLKNLSRQIEVSKLTTKQASFLSHLYQKVSATLKNGVTDIDLIRVLHPTAATLGLPKKEAFAFLKNHEGFNREFYAGCLGWIFEDKAILKVALRCAKIENKTLSLYAGAGMTKLSKPEEEILEIDEKFKTLEEVFLEKVVSN